MFSKKSDEKFEDNFKQLFIITNDLNQRLLNLESQNHLLIQRNQSLEGELNEIKYNINWNRQNLENRITDFTDMWHPLMTDNINCVEQISDHILIGFKDNETLPVFIHKNSEFRAIYKCSAVSGSVLISQSLKHLKNIKTYDICCLQGLKITDVDSNIIYNPSELNCGCPDSFGKPNKQRLSLEQMCDKRNLILFKNLLNVFGEMGIKLIMNDSEFVNGISIRKLIENI